MSYPMDLDEYSEDRLLGEMESRMRMRHRGVCDYCARRPTTPSCKFPERHNDPRIKESEPCSSCGGSGAIECPGPKAGDAVCGRCSQTGRHWCDDCQGKGVKA